jgi:hypothetical protein
MRSPGAGKYESFCVKALSNTPCPALLPPAMQTCIVLTMVVNMLCCMVVWWLWADSCSQLAAQLALFEQHHSCRASHAKTVYFHKLNALRALLQARQ